MQIKSHLANFYSHEAKKYYQTRQKPRPEGQLFVDAICSLNHQKPKILELWCGGGRFLSFFSQHYKGDFSYCGVDLAKGLLEYAERDHPQHQFICEDMSSFLASQTQEQWDIIIACSSFQHLPSPQERKDLIKNAYRSLTYNGLLLMSNRALSDWFLKTHWKIFIKSGLNFLTTLGQKSRRDVFIPRTNNHHTTYRYYHLFSLEELQSLLLTSWFVIEQLNYRDKKWNLTSNWRDANNTFVCAKKSVFL